MSSYVIIGRIAQQHRSQSKMATDYFLRKRLQKMTLKDLRVWGVGRENDLKRDLPRVLVEPTKHMIDLGNTIITEKENWRISQS